jgi:hypothetical protein
VGTYEHEECEEEEAKIDDYARTDLKDLDEEEEDLDGNDHEGGHDESREGDEEEDT